MGTQITTGVVLERMTVKQKLKSSRNEVMDAASLQMTITRHNGGKGRNIWKRNEDFKLYNSVIFSIFTKLCIHHH